MLFKRLLQLVALTAVAVSSADSALADPTPEAPAAKIPPDSPVATKDEYPRHRNAKLDLVEGEKLTYAIKWGAVDAGLATLSVKRKEQLGPDGPLVWNIQCKTRSNAFVSVFYDVKDDIMSLVDVEGGYTRMFDMDKNEGNYHASERIEFDYKTMEASYVKTRKELFSEKTRSRIIKIPEEAGRVHDPLSCLYYARTLDLQVGSEHKLTVNTDRKNWVMNLKVIREEEQDIAGLGKVQCLVIEPVAQFQGIFVRKGSMTVWVEKQTRIPLMMKVKIPIGSASAVLTKAENSPLSKVAAGANAQNEGK
jgi:hypothetical protein